MAHWKLLTIAALAISVSASELAADSSRAVRPDERPPHGWDLVLAGADEPGHRLVFSGRVFRGGGPNGGKRPFPGANVYVYHTDSLGHYGRLAGVLRTNRDGEYRVRTVLPGSYGGPRHLHFEVWGKDVARTSYWVNVFPDSSDWTRARGSSEPAPLWSRAAWRSAPPGTPPWAGNVWAPRDSSGVHHFKWDLDTRVGFPVPAKKPTSRRSG